MSYKTKPILITGGCGYVGSRVAKILADEGYKIIIADKIKPKDRKISFPKTVEFRYGDLRIIENAKKAVKGVGVVLHLAANIGPLTYMHEHQAEIMQENLDIDAALYPACVGNVDTIIYSSSSMVFQNAPHYPYKEDDLNKTIIPTNVYGFSKLAGEYFCISYNKQFNLPYVIIRYHNIYGPGEDSKGSKPGDIHVIPALVEKVLNKQYPLEFLNNPKKSTRPFTYIDDAVDTTVKIVKLTLKKDCRVLNNDFNIGPEEATNILELGEMIWRILGDKRPFKYKIKLTEAVTAERRELDNSKIKNIGIWDPKVSLDDGIMKTAEWIKKRHKHS